jgi:hypothetical protein
MVSDVREAVRSLGKDVFVSAEPLEENVRRMLEPREQARGSPEQLVF